MKRLLIVPALSLVLLDCGQPAAAWSDDGWNWWDEPAQPDYDAWEPSWWSEPVYEPEPVYVPEPAYVPEPVRVPEPAYEPQPVWDEGPLAPAPDRYEAMREAGLYEVTEVHDRDLAIIDGDRTTYTSTTEREDPGTAARLVVEAGTGELTGYEGSIVNERLSRSDGAPVAGALYENFYWSGEAWVSNGYYWFNDDSELAQHAPSTHPSEAGGSTTWSGSTGPSSAPGPIGAQDGPSSSSTAGERGDVLWSGSLTDTPGSQGHEPGRDDPRGSTGAPSPTGSTAHHDVRAGIALEAQGDVLGRIEVLRGREVHLWPRAFIDGAPSEVVAWRLVSGDLAALGPVAGGCDEPLTAMWDHVAAPGSMFGVLIEADIAVPGQGTLTVPATLTVSVRSPALVE